LSSPSSHQEQHQAASNWNQFGVSLHSHSHWHQAHISKKNNSPQMTQATPPSALCQKLTLSSPLFQLIHCTNHTHQPSNLFNCYLMAAAVKEIQTQLV